MLPQARQMGDARFVTLTLGGNDAGFFKVVDSCVYQSVREFNFYGPDYPDPAGRCWQSIDEAQSNINGTHVNHVLREQMNEAIKAIIDEAHDVDKEKAFDVFLTGESAYSLVCAAAILGKDFVPKFHYLYTKRYPNMDHASPENQSSPLGPPRALPLAADSNHGEDMLTRNDRLCFTFQ